MPLVTKPIIALQSVEEFIDRDALLLRSNEGAAAMLLGCDFSEPPFQEASGLVTVFFVHFQFVAGADVPRAFPLLLPMRVISALGRATLGGPLLSMCRNGS